MVYLFNQEWSKAEILRRVGTMEQIAGIRLLEAGDGRGRGSRVLDVWTGTGLRFQVSADRALDIGGCDFKGIPLAFRSAAGEVHPAYYEPQGLGWLRSFSGGLLTTCGLDQFGAPNQDGDKALGLHGRISNLPATQVSYRTFWVGNYYELEISGEVRQAVLFGENLVMRRQISTRLGSNRIRITDTISNEGFETSPHMLLYHFNLGFPLVSESSRIELEARETHPRDANAQSGLAAWDRFQPPTPGYQEQVFIHQPMPDEEGKVSLQLTNPQVGIGLRWSYAHALLPTLMEWKMMGEGAYVVGIEPANCNGINGQKAAREQGQCLYLSPGERRIYQIDLEVIPLARI